MNEEILDAPIGEHGTREWAKVTSYDRLKSMFLDHCMVCGVLIPLGGILILGNWFFFKEVQAGLDEVNVLFIGIAISFYLMKDILSGQSLAKRYIGQKVVDVRTNLPASELQCILRNIMISIWILEVLIVLVNPSRRLGDYIAGTKVIKTNPVPFSKTKEEFVGYNKIKLLRYWLLSLFCTIVLFFFIA